MFEKKRLLCAASLALCLSLTACAEKQSVTYDPLPEDNDAVYAIHICQDKDDDYHNAIALGFSEALNDLFGESHIRLTSTVVSSEESDGLSADSDIAMHLSNETQLLFANGPESLVVAAEMTESTPVVGAGVMDFRSTLHLTGSSDGEWNKKTGTNVTGVSSLPDMEAMLSLLIESTPDLRSVGLLYTSDDPTAVFQNRIMETYLDQAGIPWKEYLLPSSADSAEPEENYFTDPTVITPSKIVAPSATEGRYADAEDIGGSGLIDGIIAPESVHAPSVSAFWTDDLSAANTEPLPEDASTEEILSYACRECSCLYLPAENRFSDALPQIMQTAAEAGVATVGGDSTSGKDTLTCLFSDPYAMGYQAGKMAYRILIAQEDPGDIRIASSNADNIKLYNGEMAERLGRTFPKSFQEIHSFFESYEIGSGTERITDHEEDEE